MKNHKLNMIPITFLFFLFILHLKFAEITIIKWIKLKHRFSFKVNFFSLYTGIQNIWKRCGFGFSGQRENIIQDSVLPIRLQEKLRKGNGSRNWISARNGSILPKNYLKFRFARLRSSENAIGIPLLKVQFFLF